MHWDCETMGKMRDHGPELTYYWVSPGADKEYWMKIPWTINMEDSISYLAERHFHATRRNNQTLRLDRTYVVQTSLAELRPKQQLSRKGTSECPSGTRSRWQGKRQQSRGEPRTTSE